MPILLLVGLGNHQAICPPKGMTSYIIVPPDPNWPRLASEEITAIASTLNIDPKQIEHVGSTAVPGLGAKLIIDLMLGIPDFDSSQNNQQYLAPLKQIGYEFDGTETTPGTYYIRKAGPPRFNLHMTKYGGSFWLDHLLFRDYLRSHPDAVRQYEVLKVSLLDRLGPDPDKQAYNEGKSAFINGILDIARKEGASII